ncbi:putative immediate early response 2 protein [Scophthalmus maximus]|uniref:Putative immediate early response 2 protein n=1 Tax=Scophthalmus maximus TaxID=52904 RepID=A0A2U9BM90_SCOMX|nr:putative immediate early response 2 protein [Scophthalmus maximus]
MEVNAEARRILAVSISKLYASRTQRGGLRLHRSLLLSLVMRLRMKSQQPLSFFCHQNRLHGNRDIAGTKASGVDLEWTMGRFVKSSSSSHCTPNGDAFAHGSKVRHRRAMTPGTGWDLEGSTRWIFELQLRCLTDVSECVGDDEGATV